MGIMVQGPKSVHKLSAEPELSKDIVNVRPQYAIKGLMYIKSQNQYLASKEICVLDDIISDLSSGTSGPISEKIIGAKRFASSLPGILMSLLKTDIGLQFC